MKSRKVSKLQSLIKHFQKKKKRKEKGIFGHELWYCIRNHGIINYGIHYSIYTVYFSVT